MKKCCFYIIFFIIDYILSWIIFSRLRIFFFDIFFIFFQIILFINSKNLNNLNKDIISYESCIINKNIIKVWEFISDLQKVCSLTTMNVKKIEFNSPRIKEGSFLKFYLEDLKLNVFMKIVNIGFSKNKKSCYLKIETIGTNVERLPKNIEYKILNVRLLFRLIRMQD